MSMIDKIIMLLLAFAITVIALKIQSYGAKKLLTGA